MTASEPGAGTPPAAAGTWMLPAGQHEYACTVKIIVVARDVGRARPKLGQQIRCSYQVISIEPTGAEHDRWQLPEEDQPWRSGGELPGE